MVNHDVQKCTQPHQSDYPKAQSSKMFQVSNCFRSSSAARRSFISFLQPAGDLASVGDWELEHNTSNRLIDAARHISTCKQSGLPDFHSKPERKCRATSSETARESTPRWSLLFIFGLLGARWMEASQLREARESWLLTFYSSKLSEYHLGSSANEFHRSKLHYLAPKLGYYDGWRPCNAPACLWRRCRGIRWPTRDLLSSSIRSPTLGSTIFLMD